MEFVCDPKKRLIKFQRIDFFTFVSIVIQKPGAYQIKEFQAFLEGKVLMLCHAMLCYAMCVYQNEDNQIECEAIKQVNKQIRYTTCMMMAMAMTILMMMMLPRNESE